MAMTMTMTETMAALVERAERITDRRLARRAAREDRRDARRARGRAIKAKVRGVEVARLAAATILPPTAGWLSESEILDRVETIRWGQGSRHFQTVEASTAYRNSPSWRAFSKAWNSYVATGR